MNYLRFFSNWEFFVPNFAYSPRFFFSLTGFGITSNTRIVVKGYILGKFSKMTEGFKWPSNFLPSSIYLVYTYTTNIHKDLNSFFRITGKIVSYWMGLKIHLDVIRTV